MRIDVNDKYYIDVDEYNYTLKQVTGRFTKKGKPSDKTIGYFISLEAALERIARVEVDSRAERVSLGKYIELLKEVQHELASVLERYKEGEEE